MPEPSPPTSSKAKKAERDQEKLGAEYVRACRIKARSRATLIICPLSTVANWEDQFREHWRGEVTVVGGSGNCSCPPTSSAVSTNEKNIPTDLKPDKSARVREGNSLRVYIYHGNARRPDPTFLADFDAVITTFATLASEFSKQSRTGQVANEDGEDTGCGGSSDGGTSAKGETGQDLESQSDEPKSKKGGTKRKKPMTTVSSTEVASPLQSVHWFRVVLDEAQYVHVKSPDVKLLTTTQLN
jgi:SWI/SNF-related matrix-associated actin-dependent regulator of chromatin subfamily A3